MADPAANNNNKHTPTQGGTRNVSGTSRSVVQLSLPSLTPTTAQQDSKNKIWDMYLEEAKKDDDLISDAWKEDSNGIIVFVSPDLLVTPFISMTSFKTSLFAGTVSAFILEFYKQLSSNSSQTVTFLPNGTFTVTGNPPSPPSASIIWANAMWMISLVLSLTSALIATLLQQWARGYVEMPKRPGDPNHRARVRSFLFLGTEIYKMHFAVHIAPTLLHLSVYLFFAGLVLVFRTINNSVAIAVEVSVGVFGLAYIALSILPCLDVRCPYRTPMSYFLWYPTHAILFFSAVCLRRLVDLFHPCCVGSNTGEITSRRQEILVRWSNSRDKAGKTHWQYIMHGIRKSIINSAINTEGDGDRRIVTRLFNLLAMGDISKYRKFAACIPRDKVFDLIPRIKSKKIVLQEPLRILIKSYAAGTSVAGPDEEVRKHSLLVCLEAIRNIVKDPSVPDLNYVRANFANINLMRALWDDSDTAICVTSRSICALIAKQVVREPSLEESQISWLQEVTGLRAVYDADINMRTRMNLKSFARGVLSNPVGDLPTQDARSIKETLAILLDLDVENDANFDTNFQILLAQVVNQIHEDDPEGNGDVVHQLRTMFLLIPSTDPSSHAQGVPPHVANIDPPSHVGPSMIAGQSHRYLA